MKTEQERKYWNGRYGKGQTSGKGSYGDEYNEKVKLISDELNKLHISSILDIGCGDMHLSGGILGALKTKTNYTGVDVSDVVLEKNRKGFPKLTFMNFQDICKGSDTFDAVLCIDVLFHVIDDSTYTEILDFIRKKYTKIAIISSFDCNGKKSGHICVRKFEFKELGTRCRVMPILPEVATKYAKKLFFVEK